MPNVNKFYGVGHLGQNPEVRTAQSGTVVATFTGCNFNIRKEKTANGLSIPSGAIACVSENRLNGSVKRERRFVHFFWPPKNRIIRERRAKRYITKIICDDVDGQKGIKAPSSYQENSFKPANRTFDDLSDDIPF